jgi:excisionase family DNA binding protein
LSILHLVADTDPIDELRRLYPPILTTAHVAEMMHCTIGDVRDKVHRGELRAVRWGQQFRFFRDEVLAALKPYHPGEVLPADETDEGQA